MKTTLSINQPFKDWVNHLKQDIRSAQIKAAVRVNSELLHLYWQLGAEIIERQKEMTWGSGFLEELSRELMAEFPDMKGFSYRNIRSIKQWYLFYNEPYTIWQQVVSKLGEEKFFSIPWGHHLYIISPSLSFTSSRVAAISSRTRSPVLQRIGIALCRCISSYIFAGDNYSPCRASKGNPSVSLRRTVCFNMENSLFH